jgi:hypothetical protein
VQQEPQSEAEVTGMLQDALQEAHEAGKEFKSKLEEANFPKEFCEALVLSFGNGVCGAKVPGVCFRANTGENTNMFAVTQQYVYETKNDDGP